MINKITFLIILLYTTLCCGCINRVPIYYCKNASFKSKDQEISLAQRTNEITLKANNKKWNTEVIKQGEIQAYFNGVNYSCEILIEYNKQFFNIYYLKSRHMFYNPEKHSIHVQYNYLIRQLENSLKSK